MPLLVGKSEPEECSLLCCCGQRQVELPYPWCPARFSFRELAPFVGLVVVVVAVVVVAVAQALGSERVGRSEEGAVVN